MPAGRLGMWFFLASEGMFFLGLLGAFIVLQSVTQQHLLFVKSSAMLSWWQGLASAALLTLSSVAILLSPRPSVRWLAIVAAVVFLLLQGWQWQKLLQHHTYIVRISGQPTIVDGYEDHTHRNLTGVRQIELPNGFDVFQTIDSDLPRSVNDTFHFNLSGLEILQDNNYGPSRNNFFACYFLFTAVHALHMLVGVIAWIWFAFKGRGVVADSVQMYWHFVNAVGLIGYGALYFM